MFSVTFGVGLSEARRQLVSFAEGIERYALSVDPPHVAAKRFSELDEHALSPAETVRFAAEQLSGAPGAPRRYEDERLDWSWAYDFVHGGARLLPHDVFAADRRASPGAVRWVGDPFSSGAAAHRSVPRAVRRALLELLERDALMLAWYLRLPLPELDLLHAAAHSVEIRELHEYLTERGIELRAFDLRVDFELPTVLVTARARVDSGQWRAGGCIVAPSAAGGWGEAIAHALHEILGHYSAFAVVAPAGDSSLDPVTGAPHLWWANFAACFEPQEHDPLSFLGNGTLRPVPMENTLESVEALLTTLRSELRARKLSAFIHYLAPETVRASGLVALRACIPGLLRMTPSRETVNFGEPRIEQIRARWGAPAGFNEHPHPIS
jgi:ribosomal protein S12 methylthiotransferase accessory factor